MKNVIKTIRIIILMFSFVILFSFAGAVDISYVTDIVSDASNYSQPIFNYVQDNFEEYACYETDNYFFAYFYPIDNMYFTPGFFSGYENRLVSQIPFDGNKYLYRTDATFNTSLFKQSYLDPSKISFGCYLVYNKDTRTIYMAEHIATAVANNRTENLSSYNMSDVDNSNLTTGGAPFYYYQRYDTMTGYSLQVLLGNSIYASVLCGNVYNRYSTSPNVGIVNSDNTIRFAFEQEPPASSAVSDDRLQLYTLKDSAGNQNLVVDLTKFRYHTPAGTVTFSDVVLNLDCDGSIVPFSLPAASSEVVDIYNYNNVAYSILTPYKAFNLDNFDNVFVSSVSFNLVTSTAGGVENQAFNISAEYWLKKTADPFAPEEIPDPEYSDPVVKDTEDIEALRDSLESATTSRPSAFSGEWVFLQEHPQVPSWASNYDFRVIRSLSQISQLVNVNVYNYYYDNNPNGLDWLHGSFNPRTFLDENRDFAYYDMIIISCYKADLVADTTSAAPSLTYQNIELEGYLVFYSQRFYIKQQGITQQDILLSSELSAQNAKAYYDYMKLKLDDFEAKTLFGLSNIIDLNKDGVSWLQTINNKCNLLDSSLNSGFSSVVTAIENIPQPDPFDDSNIISSIDTGFLNLQNRMTYLFVPSFSWQAVNYTEYLDSLGILSVPFRFGSQALNGLENNYSSNFEFQIAAFNMPLPDGGSFRLWDQQDIDFNIVEAGLPGSLWSTLQNFFFWICVIAQSYYTYCHLFRKEGGEDLDI